MNELERYRGGVMLERRDPQAATRPLVYTSPGLGQVAEWDAAAAFRLGYIANVIAYRCVQIQARDFASVPLRAGTRYRDKATMVEGAPILRLLGPPPGGPAPKLSARKLLRWTAAQQIVTGRRAWEIETADGRADGTPVAFWPLVAANLEMDPTEGGTEWFKVFRYGRSDKKRTLDPGFVFYGWDPSGLDFRQAESALQAARFDLSLAIAADRYSVAFLRNNATPATVVTTTSFPTQSAREAFRRQWSSEYGGYDNAGRTLFHEVGDDGDEPVGETIDVQRLGLSQRDAQLVETRKTALMEVAMSLGVPWSKLDASGRTFDNAEVEDRTYWEEQVLPMLLDFEDDLNMQVAPRLGDEVVWFDLDEVRVLRQRTKPVTSAVGVPSLVQAQVMTINEGRADYGLPPIEGGDRFMTAEEIAALKGAGGAIDVALRDPGPAEARGTEVETLPAPPPAAVPSVPEHRAEKAEDAEVRRSKVWRTTDATVRGLESRWERAWRRLFARQAKATLSRLEGKRGRQAVNQEHRAPADEVFDRAFWEAEANEVAADLYEGVTAAGAGRVSAIFGVAFDLEAEWAQAFVRSRANQLAGQVTQTTYDAIANTLAEGIGEGESIPDLATRIRHVFDVADQARATTIARTEVISAFNGSAHLSATQLPSDVVGGQEWIATRDGRTRPEHAAADGQVVAMDAAFDVGGEALLYPGDPGGSGENVIQCRCTTAFLTPDEMAERAGRAREIRVVPISRARHLLDLVHPNIDLLAFRRALAEEAA